MAIERAAHHSYVIKCDYCGAPLAAAGSRAGIHAIRRTAKNFRSYRGRTYCLPKNRDLCTNIRDFTRHADHETPHGDDDRASDDETDANTRGGLSFPLW